MNNIEKSASTIDATYKKEIDVYVGKNVRKARRNKKMSVKNFSDSLKVDANVLRKYELGEVKIDSMTLYRIASKLNVKLSDLFGIASRKDRRMIRDNPSM